MQSKIIKFFYLVGGVVDVWPPGILEDTVWLINFIFYNLFIFHAFRVLVILICVPGFSIPAFRHSGVPCFSTSRYLLIHLKLTKNKHFKINLDFLWGNFSVPNFETHQRTDFKSITLQQRSLECIVWSKQSVCCSNSCPSYGKCATDSEDKNMCGCFQGSAGKDGASGKCNHCCPVKGSNKINGENFNSAWNKRKKINWWNRRMLIKNINTPPLKTGR